LPALRHMSQTYALCANTSLHRRSWLVRSNTAGLLKRTAPERKKSNGAVPPKRSTSSKNTLLTRVLLGRFPMRPVPQSASSCGLASWTGQYFPSCSPRVCLGASCPRFSVTFIIEHFYLSMACQIDRVKNRRPFPARETRKTLLDRTSASVLWSS